MTNGPSSENWKQLFTAIVAALKEIDSDLLAYEMAFSALKLTNPVIAKTFEISLTAAKLSQRYQTILLERYDSKLEQFLQQVSDVQTLTKACEEWLRARKTDNGVN
jgi:hypothetical protein